MSGRTLRNPGLYARMLEACRKGILPDNQVKVSSPGHPLSYGAAEIGTGHRTVDNFGECYRVNCPACGDRRRRLYVSHAWGEVREGEMKPDYRLIKCHNEGCQKNVGFIQDMISNLDPLLLGTIQGDAGSVDLSGTVSSDVPQPKQHPSVITSLRSLGDAHPAVHLLLSRYVAPRTAESEYGFGWIDSANWGKVSNRLYVPVFMQGILYGWQARYIDDHGSSVANLYECDNPRCRHRVRSAAAPRQCPACGGDEIAPVVKWLSCPGMRKNQLLMNYDGARAWPDFTVVVEGPLDVASMGSPMNPNARGPVQASLGHVLSAYQRDRLLLPWASSGGVIFLAYDSDVWNKTVEQAVEMSRAGVTTVPVLFPDGADPADIGPEMAWACVRRAAEEFGVYERLKRWLG
jgi:hypothetical protein